MGYGINLKLYNLAVELKIDYYLTGWYLLTLILVVYSSKRDVSHICSVSMVSI